MARRIRTLTAANSPLTVGFGADSNTLRVTQLFVPDNHGGEPANGRVAITVNTATAPVTTLDNDDDDTRILPATGIASEFTESAPSGPWDVRLALISGDRAIVELEEF